jgi:hypothetical protein
MMIRYRFYNCVAKYIWYTVETKDFIPRNKYSLEDQFLLLLVLPLAAFFRFKTWFIDLFTVSMKSLNEKLTVREKT